MRKFAVLAGQGGAGWAIAATLVIVGAGLAVWQPWATAPEAPVTQPAPLAHSEAQPAAQPAPETTAQPDPAPQAAAAPMAPRLTFLRVDPDGVAQIAGQADAGALVELLLDGAKIAETMAGRDGAFAHLFDLPASDAPRALSAQAIVGDVTVASVDQLLVLPVAQVVAQAPETVEPTPIQKPAAVPPTTGATDSTPTEPGTPENGTADTGAPAPQAVEPVVTTKITPAPHPSAPAVVRATPEGVTMLQLATPANTPPEVLAQIALDAISYDDAGEVALTGRGAAGDGGYVRVYLDNTPITTARIAPDGRWRTDLPAVDSGVYTLRVDQVSANGKVTSRLETPFKREEPTVLASAAPADVIARVVTVQPGATLWAIARDRYGAGTQYLQVFEANRDRIRNPDLIYPGQVFDLPDAD